MRYYFLVQIACDRRRIAERETNRGVEPPLTSHTPAFAYGHPAERAHRQKRLYSCQYHAYAMNSTVAIRVGTVVLWTLLIRIVILTHSSRESDG